LVHANAGDVPTRRRRESPSEEEPIPEADFISREVDPILEKISAHGLQSLTERERRVLEKARRKLRQ
jgi:hypothetical protein